MALQMLRLKPKVKLYLGDCREVLADMEAESVHMVLTNPPYFLDGLDGDLDERHRGPRGTGAIGGLLVGMKFDPVQEGAQSPVVHGASSIRTVPKAQARSVCPGIFGATACLSHGNCARGLRVRDTRRICLAIHAPVAVQGVFDETLWRKA